ncbi:MAG: hypothetical protein DRP01_00730 [Archaeoglobales archaeon]|nr:MAG: hypothetical protein DRP01_00730 [Archaeoglobales archaeon]
MKRSKIVEVTKRILRFIVRTSRGDTYMLSVRRVKYISERFLDTTISDNEAREVFDIIKDFVIKTNRGVIYRERPRRKLLLFLRRKK